MFGSGTPGCGCPGGSLYKGPPSALSRLKCWKACSGDVFGFGMRSGGGEGKPGLNKHKFTVG